MSNFESKIDRNVTGCVAVFLGGAIGAALLGKFLTLYCFIACLTILGVTFPAISVPLLLMMATIAMPFCGSMSGTESSARNLLIAFGFTDMLLFAALPGAIRLIWIRRRTLLFSLPKTLRHYWCWTLLFLLVATGSFLFNFRMMGHGWAGYASGWLRTFQVLVLIPIAFASCEWNNERFRTMWRGYCASVFFLLITVLGIYIAGGAMVPIYGVHKNVVGLLIATGVFVALYSAWNRDEKRLLPEPLEFKFLVLGMPALVASNSRSSQIAFAVALIMTAFQTRRWKLPLALLVGLFFSLYGGTRLRQPVVYAVKTFVSLKDPSIQERFDQYQMSLARFRASPIIGDGLRARKDTTPHNLEILLLAETGVLGLLSFGGILIAVARLYRSTLARFGNWDTVGILVASSLAVIVHSQADPFWRRGPLWLLAMGVGISWSLACSEQKGGGNQNEQDKGTE